MKATIIIKEKADIRLDIKSVGRGSTVRIQSSANFYMEHLLTVNCKQKTKIKKKRPTMAFYTKSYVWEREITRSQRIY